MADFDNNDPEEIIITSDDGDDDNSSREKRQQQRRDDREKRKADKKSAKDDSEEEMLEEDEDGNPIPKNNKKGDGGDSEDGNDPDGDGDDDTEQEDEEDENEAETVDVAFLQGRVKGEVKKIPKDAILAQSPIYSVEYEVENQNGERESHWEDIFLIDSVLVGDYVAYDVNSDAGFLRIGKIVSIQDNGDSEKNTVEIRYYWIVDANHYTETINISKIAYKMPNCAIISGRYKGRVGFYYENDVDSSGKQVIQLLGNKGDDWASDSAYNVFEYFDKKEFVTIGDKIKFQSGTNEILGTIEDRFISWGSPNQNPKEDGNNFLWIKPENATFLWVDVKDLLEVQQPNQGVLNSLTIEIINDIISQFKAKGTYPNNWDNFLYCHLPNGLRKSVHLLDRAHGKDNSQIEIEMKSTLETMKEFDREVAKALLRHIQYSGYDFEPLYAFGSILYNCLKEIGVFNMKNTLIMENSKPKISIFRDKNKLMFYSEYMPTFMQEIIFGDRKNIIKFDLWQNERAEKLSILYSLLCFLVGVSRLSKEERVGVIEYPDFNREIGTIYLTQLKALQDAV